jgi:hypothetical protein
MTISKFSATAVISIGASLVGVIAGWDLALLTPALGQSQLSFVSAVACLIFAVIGCCIARERAEAQAQKERQLALLKRLGVLIVRSIREDRRLRQDHVTSRSA